MPAALSSALYIDLVTRANLGGNVTRLVNVLAGYGPQTEAKFLKLLPHELQAMPNMGKATLNQALELQSILVAMKSNGRAKPTPPVTYATEQRYRLIDFLLSQYGWINRAMVMDYFGISSACASNDIATYSDMLPSNIWYNAKSKRYETTGDFQRVYP